MKEVIKKALKKLHKQDELDIFEFGDKDIDSFTEEHKELLKETTEIERILMNIDKFLEFENEMACNFCGKKGAWNFFGDYMCPDCLHNCMKKLKKES